MVILGPIHILVFEKKNIGRNPIVDCERNGEKNRKRMEKNRKG